MYTLGLVAAIVLIVAMAVQIMILVQRLGSVEHQVQYLSAQVDALTSKLGQLASTVSNLKVIVMG